MKPLLALAAVIAAGLALQTPGAMAADANGCDKYASTAVGSTITTPQQLHDALAPGQVGCFRAGTYTTTNLNITKADTTFKSVPGQQAVWRGRIVIQADNVTVRGLRLDGSYGPCLNCTTGARHASLVIGSTNAKILSNDISNRRESVSPAPTAGICVNQASGGPDISGFRIEGNRIHNCGQLPATNRDHGIYISWGVNQAGGLIKDNVIYDNADRGVQLAENAWNVDVDNNTIDGNGQGILYGGEYSEDPAVYTRQSVSSNNIITNSNVRDNLDWFDLPSPTQVPSTGNAVTNVCLRASNANPDYNDDNGIAGGFRPRVPVTGDVTAPADVYVNRSAKDFRRNNGCAGMGAPDGVAEPPAFASNEQTVIIDGCGALRIRPVNGTLETPWADATGLGCSAGAKWVAAGGGRIAYVNGSDQLLVKEGAGAFQWQRNDVKAADVNASAVLTLDLDGKVYVKEGSLSNAWNPSLIASNIKVIDLAPSGTTFVAINQSNVLTGKNTGFFGGWITLTYDVVDVKISNSRVVTLQTCPTPGQYQVNGKLGGIDAAWFGPILGCGQAAAIALGGTRLAVVNNYGMASVKNDLDAPWTHVLDAGQAPTNNLRAIAVNDRLAIADSCGGLLSKDLTSSRGLDEPLVRSRDCGDGIRQVVTGAP